MDLIKESWLPVIRIDGKKTKISLIDLLDDTIIDTAYVRADFQNAAWQMLIGLLQSTIAPEDDEGWEELFLRHFSSAPKNHPFCKALTRSIVNTVPLPDY
jgi:CRISPR system Cascade subunit CasA